MPYDCCIFWSLRYLSLIDLDICRLLIDKGARVEIKERDCWTPLHIAAINSHIEVVRLLCDRGAHVEARTSRGNWHPGRRPLHLAAADGHISIVKELIEVRNAEINGRNGNGEAALWIARRSGKADIVAYLISRGGIE